jgi:peptide chain release factor subunit 1
VLDEDKVQRINALDGGDYPVLSVYLGFRPGEPAGVAARLKELLGPIRRETETMDRDAAMSVKADVDAVLDMAERLVPDSGNGLALFRCAGIGFAEQLKLPARVRDRAVLDTTAYTRPLTAIREYFRRFCAVVIERRRASIFQFYLGELTTWEEMWEEEVRKANFGGFAGYEEQRVRSRTGEIAARHYRDVAARLVDLSADPGFDLLLIGGPQEHVEGLRSALRPDLSQRLAGTFGIDPNTMTPAIVRDHCHRLAADWDAARERAAVGELMDKVGAGGAATAGVEATLQAVNQRAVHTLYLQAGHAMPGAVCTDCGWLDPDVATAQCPACGEAMRRVPDLLDAMADSVRSAGGTVQNILAETPLTDHQVGADLRFRVNAAV